MENSTFKTHLKKVFTVDERPVEELDRMFDLMELFQRLPPPPDPLGIHSDYPRLKNIYHESIESGDCEEIETAFLQVYCNAHGYEAPYTRQERLCVNKTGGYWAHSGGISPLIKAGAWINRDTVSADFGAGNGLQGLLLQWLYPHKKTVQIEISSRMIESGKALRKWLKIPAQRVEWISDNVMNHNAENYDFIYIYRPLKPEGKGIQFYSQFAEEIARSERSVVVFSIADCLSGYLSNDFEMFYSDGHLTCFKRKDWTNPSVL